MAVSLFFTLGWTGQRTQPAEGATFIAQFSSADDVKRKHPTIDKTLDVLAGPAPAERSLNSLQLPYGVTRGPGNRVIVSDVGERKVHVFDFGGSKHSILRDNDQLVRPAGLATDRDGNIYVCDSGSAEISVFDPAGKFQHYLKEPKAESYFEAPVGIAIDPGSGRIYVSDSPRHMIIGLNATGRVLDRFGTRGGGTRGGEFRYPTQLAIASGELYVVDSGNHRIQVLDLAGHFRREIKVADLEQRSGVAVDRFGRIYVSDGVLDRVRVFGRDGQSIHYFGQTGATPGEFQGPSGLWLDAGHCLYVIDAGNRRVQLFQTDGQNPKTCRLR